MSPLRSRLLIAVLSAVGVFVVVPASPSSAQQSFPPDTQAQPAPATDQESQPQQQQNSDTADQQTQPAEAPAQENQPAQPEPQQVQPRPMPEVQPPVKSNPRETRSAKPAGPTQRRNPVDVQQVTPGEVTVGGGALARLRQDWQAAWNSRRLDDLMALYSDDAVLLLSEGQRIMGKEAIRGYFQQVLTAGNSHIVFSSISTFPADKLAYDDGTFNETVEASKAEEGQNGVATGARRVRGNYLIVAGKSDNAWTIREQAIDGLK